MADPAEPAAGGISAESSGAVLAEIRRVLREELELQRVAQPGDDLVSDLQLDSVGLLTLVVGLENRFRVVLSEEDAATVRTVADLVALVESRR
jgi:acyl carrier protein